MGMAASQARHISLVARKTNVEWEGQQINQARTALANKTASLFNQMLGMTVPDCPDTTDFTKVQYSYNDGLNASTIDSYYQISNPEPEYNYVVTHSYYTDVYTGSLKKLNDPQVQLDTAADVPTLIENYNTKSAALATAQEGLDAKGKDLDDAKTALLNIAHNTSAPVSVEETTYNEGTKNYTIKVSGSDTVLSPVTLADKDGLIALIGAGTLGAEFTVDDIDSYIAGNQIYKNGNDYYKASELETLYAGGGIGTIDKYNVTTDADDLALVTGYNSALDAYNSYKSSTYTPALNEFNTAAREISGAMTYVGNCKLSVVDLASDESEAIRTELNQIVKDMKKDEINASILASWDNTAMDGDKVGNFVPGRAGTIFSFQMNNVTYFTTIEDLMESYNSGTGNNNIDGQKKMAYYSANYVSTKITKTERALLETDGAGRFTSVKFEDDTVKYVLNTETTTDTDAYNNAMNQYYYEVQKYEKTIADINAQTEIIQNQDRTLELRLKQLDTEESALSNEIDAVKKVLKDNVEKSFKTFAE